MIRESSFYQQGTTLETVESTKYDDNEHQIVSKSTQEKIRYSKIPIPVSRRKENQRPIQSIKNVVIDAVPSFSLSSITTPYFDGRSSHLKWNYQTTPTITTNSKMTPYSLDISSDLSPMLSSPPKTPIIRMRSFMDPNRYFVQSVSPIECETSTTSRLKMSNTTKQTTMKDADFLRTPDSILKLTANIKTPILRHVQQSRLRNSPNHLDSPLSFGFSYNFDRQGTPLTLHLPLQTIHHPMLVHHEGRRR